MGFSFTSSIRLNDVLQKIIPVLTITISAPHDASVASLVAGSGIFVWLRRPSISYKRHNHSFIIVWFGNVRVVRHPFREDGCSLPKQPIMTVTTTPIRLAKQYCFFYCHHQQGSSSSDKEHENKESRFPGNPLYAEIRQVLNAAASSESDDFFDDSYADDFDRDDVFGISNKESITMTRPVPHRHAYKLCRGRGTIVGVGSRIGSRISNT